MILCMFIYRRNDDHELMIDFNGYACNFNVKYDLAVISKQSLVIS